MITLKSIFINLRTQQKRSSFQITVTVFVGQSIVKNLNQIKELSKAFILNRNQIYQSQIKKSDT